MNVLQRKVSLRREKRKDEEREGGEGRRREEKGGVVEEGRGEYADVQGGEERIKTLSSIRFQSSNLSRFCYVPFQLSLLYNRYKNNTGCEAFFI